MLFKKRAKCKYIYMINQYEYHLILDALIWMRNKKLEAGCFTDAIDDAILKIIKQY